MKIVPMKWLGEFRLIKIKYPFLFPIFLLLFGILIFSASAYYSFVSNNRGVENSTYKDNQPKNPNTSGGEVRGTIDTSSPAPIDQITSKKSASNAQATPTPTLKPADVKEVHTKETVEQKTVVVVTATPVPTATAVPVPTATPTAVPSPTSTPDTRPFEITTAHSGNNFTVTANKDLKSCNCTVCICGPSGCNLTICTVLSGSISANTCTLSLAADQWIEQGSVESVWGESKSF